MKVSDYWHNCGLEAALNGDPEDSAPSAENKWERSWWMRGYNEGVARVMAASNAE